MKLNYEEILLATTIKNSVKNINDGFEYSLKNIIINGEKRGCSGFVKNPVNNKVVYLTTERSCCNSLHNKIMYRYAKDTKDYSSNGLGVLGRNRWCEYDKHIIAKCIVDCLENDLR
jgi:hypothetical protein